MKKIVLMSLLLSMTLFGETKAKVNPAETMQALEASMSMIQKGFLYNNKTMLSDAIASMKSKLGNIDSFIIVNEKDKEFDAKKYAAKETKAILALVNYMEKLYNEDKKTDALEAYSNTLSRCVVCHKVIRKW